MKRAEQLQPLSRQHHLGLNLSHHAKECFDTPKDIDTHLQNLTAYLNDMKSYFEIEDHIIAIPLKPYEDANPELASVLATLNEQHSALRKFMTDSYGLHTKLLFRIVVSVGIIAWLGLRNIRGYRHGSD